MRPSDTATTTRHGTTAAIRRLRAVALVVASTVASTVASGAAQDPLQARIAKALEQARPALLHHLGKADLGELALVCLAAVHDGVPLDDRVFAAALDRLSRATIEDTYGLALRLMVMAEVPTFARRDELAARDTEMLLLRQTTGGFSYHQHDGWWDLSNTQYAVLGLRAAAALGQKIEPQTWQLIYQSVRAMQHDAGGFPYRLGQGEPSAYPSMTVAGIAVLQVCAQQLAMAAADRECHDRYVDRAWDWLAARKDAIGDRRTRSCHYFLYGLERAAILSDRDQVGGLDWYATGAKLLCDEQLGDGGWWSNTDMRAPAPRSKKGHAVDTAFAVLFLRRKFQKVQAPATGPRGLAATRLPPVPGPRDVDDAVADAIARGDAAVPELLNLLRADAEPRRRVAVLALRAIAGQDFGIDPKVDAGGNAAAIRAADLWWLRRRRDR